MEFITFLCPVQVQWSPSDSEINDCRLKAKNATVTIIFITSSYYDVSDVWQHEQRQTPPELVPPIDSICIYIDTVIYIQYLYIYRYSNIYTVSICTVSI